MILHGKESGGCKYNANDIRDALEIFLRSRNAYMILWDYLILPCDKTLKSCFGKLGSTGNSEECKSSVGNVFSEHDGPENYCFITADEIYVKAAVRYRAGHMTGLGEDQDPPKIAKTVLPFMINFLFGIPSFIARLVPVTTLKSECLMGQLMMSLQIIHLVFLIMTDNLSVNQKLHDAGGLVFLIMTDNLSVNQKLLNLNVKTNSYSNDRCNYRSSLLITCISS